MVLNRPSRLMIHRGRRALSGTGLTERILEFSRRLQRTAETPSAGRLGGAVRSRADASFDARHTPRQSRSRLQFTNAGRRWTRKMTCFELTLLGLLLAEARRPLMVQRLSAELIRQLCRRARSSSSEKQRTTLVVVVPVSSVDKPAPWRRGRPFHWWARLVHGPNCSDACSSSKCKKARDAW